MTLGNEKSVNGGYNSKDVVLIVVGCDSIISTIKYDHSHVALKNTCCIIIAYTIHFN